MRRGTAVRHRRGARAGQRRPDPRSWRSSVAPSAAARRRSPRAGRASQAAAAAAGRRRPRPAGQRRDARGRRRRRAWPAPAPTCCGSACCRPRRSRFLTADAGADLGVVLSASHNPMPDNGIKLFAARRAQAARRRRGRDRGGGSASPGPAPTGAGVGRVRRPARRRPSATSSTCSVATPAPARRPAGRRRLRARRGLRRSRPRCYRRAGAEVDRASPPRRTG